MFVCVSAPSGGFSAFGGLVTKGFGFSSFTAILTGLPQPAITIIAMVVGSYLNNKLKKRFLVIAVICLFPIAGQASLISIPRDHPGALLGVQYIGNMSGSLRESESTQASRWLLTLDRTPHACLGESQLVGNHQASHYNIRVCE